MARLEVNGTPHELTEGDDRSLLVFLREELDLTGTKLGCGEGECSACTVLVGSRATRSCVTPLSEVAGQQVTTIEGLGEEGYLHPVQQAFVEERAMQCGYCTAGWVMGTAALLNRVPQPSDAQIDDELAGHVCRCCTYPRIRRAVHRAAELLADPEYFADQPARLPVVEADPVEFEPWDLATPSAERFAPLGPGLVCCYPADRRPERPDVSGKSRRLGGAWLHVAPDGAVTAFAGKVEIGQGARTVLAVLVAEELRVPVEQVAMVLGDTAFTPYDAGTSGSQTMIEIGECLRAAASAARTALVRLAAERLGVDPERLDAGPGYVDDPGSGRSCDYSELLGDGQRVEEVPEESGVTPPEKWTTAGVPTPAAHGFEVVTGRKRYPYDLTRPGMLHGKVLRAPAYGARLAEVDLPAPGGPEGARVVREEDFVGAVATTPAGAAALLERVDARWATEPQPGEEELEGHLRAHPIAEAFENSPFHAEEGDPDAALAGAATRLTATFHAAYLAHVPLEPRSAIAEWRGDHLTVWTGTQRPFPARQSIAEHFGLPEHRVRVVVPDFGSGFGGKHYPDVAIEAARLARAVGRPVKVQWSRAEEFTWAYFRPAAVIDVDAGLDEGGRLVGWTFRNLNSGPAGITTPYAIPHQRIDYQPADSPLAHGSYRALAATANNFARESHIDDCARAAGIDSVEFRLRHLERERLRAVLEAVAERVGWGEARSGRALGIACAFEKSSYVATCAEIDLDEAENLIVRRITTSFDCGAMVNPDNVLNQIEGATVMGLGGALFEAVHFAEGRVTNGSMAAYRVPRLADVPEIDVVLLDRRDCPPVGASETPIVGIAPAIANAVAAATGRRLRSMPLAPEGSLAGRGD